jgi:hypothetical protein
MAGNYQDRERRSGYMPDERSNQRRDERPDARNDERWGRQDERRDERLQGGGSQGGWHDRDRDWRDQDRQPDWRQGRDWRQGSDWQPGREDWRRDEAGGRGGSDYGGDWRDERAGGGGPDYLRGGGFGGPQDRYSRGLPDRNGPGGWRVGAGQMPDSLPGGRGGQQYGRGAEEMRGGEDAHASGPSHRGRGPKGYQRSDERLKELVCERLSDDHRVDASEISVEVKNGEVTVEGEVSDRGTKYRVEDLIEQCGVREIHNRLRVQDRSGAQSSEHASGYTDKASAGGRGAGHSRQEGGERR